jgi:hypothetical protein
MVNTIHGKYNTWLFWLKYVNKLIQFYKMLTSFLIKHDILIYRLVLQKDKSPLNF